MKVVEQVNITMPNVPSSLAKVGDKLRAADVNIDAIACSEGKNQTIIHLIVDDPETASLVLKDLGTVSGTMVLELKVHNRPGAIADIGRGCAAMGINIRMIYSSTCGKEAMVYVAVDGDAEEAIANLKKWEKNSGRLM